MKSLICFDYDGVLVDSLDRLVQVAQEAQSSIERGRALRVEDFRTIPNLTFKDLGMLAGMSEAEAERYSERVLALQRSNSSYPALFPGIPDLLKSLCRDSVLVIVTSSASAEVEQVLSRNKVGTCIAKILDGADPRPKSERIGWALDHFAASPTCSFMVGDSRGDIRHGKLAGVHTVGVTWGYQPREILLMEDPETLVDSPADLAKLLGEHRGQPLVKT